ncbi:hypothetical protein [Dyella sp.]|jgi:hypothetical protein|uniref:hypothetical protein n=1 Tax=Dyella sp. TaxID=1869338 RepID=UPI002FD8E9D5
METTNENAGASPLHQTEVEAKDNVHAAGTDVAAAAKDAVEVGKDVAAGNVGTATADAHGVLTEIENAWHALENVPAEVGSWFKTKFEELRAKL